MGFISRRKSKKKYVGFTLIELLIVIGILAVLLAITIIAINPLEQINKASDITTKSAAHDFASATKYYFTYKKSLPWIESKSCHDELTTSKTLSEATACTNELTEGGQLQQNLINSDESKNIFITECNGAVALCYHPKSQQFGKDSDAIYTKNGVIQPGCPSTSQECYSCTFTTNQAQECFQALNPNNGTLAIGPTPSPDEVLPIPDRHSKSTCSQPTPGKVSCMAEVVTDSSGTPLSSIGLPAGFGPTQIHTAYNLPCTPGGPINSKCNVPQAFGPQIVAVILAYHTPTIESDLATYSATYGLPPCTSANGCLTIVNQNGATSPLPSVDSNWALEASLDVQMSHAVCQTCKILLVEANSNSMSDLAAATNRAAQMGATSISNSYGAAEWSGQTAYDASYNHPGVAVVAASGDWGYGTYYPAASKNVIAVGGTTLSLLADNSYSSESVWNGTGSGCSLYEPAGSYQINLSNWGLTGCGIKKGITDISAVANPNTGVAIYDSTPYSGHSGWWILGGTSVSSPIIGAAISLEGGISSSTNGPEALYSDLSKFRDVIAGSNGSCGGKTSCTASVGYDGPTGLGSIKLLSDTQPTSQQPTPTLTPILSPTPTSVASASGTPSPTSNPNCTTQQTVWLNRADPITALPGDTVNNTLTVTNNDPVGCSTQFTINQGFPTDWTVTGIPASFTLSGGATKTLPFTIQVPTTATVGNYTYQFWVAKQGQSSVNPINGSVQVSQAAPTNTPTPTPITCTHGWTNTLGSTSMSGNPGDTINETITIVNNNPASCGSALFTISYSYPTGWTITNLPASVTINGGESKTIQFTITINSQTQQNDYILQFWILSGSLPMNATIHVLSSGPTNTPTPTTIGYNCGNGNLPAGIPYQTGGMNAYLYKDDASFIICNPPAAAYEIDVSYDANFSPPVFDGMHDLPNWTLFTRGSCCQTFHGLSFGEPYTWGTPFSHYGPLGASLISRPNNGGYGFIPANQVWANWQCGKTLYWRAVDFYDSTKILSATHSNVISCDTPQRLYYADWGKYYDGNSNQQILYDSRWDANHNGRMDWEDYWDLVFEDLVTTYQ